MIKYLIIVPVKIYQWFISPVLGPNCRHSPTCSHYMLGAVEEWGPFVGLGWGLSVSLAAIHGVLQGMILCRKTLKKEVTLSFYLRAVKYLV
ncbi:hypothetical protein A3SI_02828 [Nitritalea halalkaliphila LW7]|uniref:Membrane protein insertion efficiency factor n=1 Tax=Nitritalea halalkaliphila LW7 TaxID=1189621 RepID=I5C9F8_9BACT|nr:hypothetical protein A3SI_02828 [Nitritalea halalkaliphila LW7]